MILRSWETDYLKELLNCRLIAIGDAIHLEGDNEEVVKSLRTEQTIADTILKKIQLAETKRAIRLKQ